MLGFVGPKAGRGRKFAAALATLSLVAAGLVFQAGIDTPGAWAAVAKTNLILSYDATNPSSYPGSGNTITDLSGGGHTGTMAGSSGYGSGAFTYTAGGNGTSYTTVGGDLNGFQNGVTVSFEGQLGAGWDNWERIISVGNLAPNANGIYGGTGDGFWVGRYWNTSELVIEAFSNGVSTGQCRTVGAGASDATYARWTFEITSSKQCRIFKNGTELTVNNSGGANSASGGVLMNVALSSVSHTYNYLGRSHWTGDSDLGGGIRWIKVYNTGLSPTDITDEYTGSVTFDPNGASNTMSTQSSTTVASLTSNTLTRSGYTFAGWNTAANGTGTGYGNGATYSFGDDITLYAQWTLNSPTVSSVATVAGTAKSGQTLTATPATYAAGPSPTVTSKWQRSSDNSNWTDISGATSTTYALTDSDAGTYVRYFTTITNAAGTTTTNSTPTSMVLSTKSVTAESGAANSVGSMFTVPPGSTYYNVTLTSSNLSGKFSFPSAPAGITWVEGYSTTASYMPTSITGTGSIFSFRGTGDDINAALATLNYNSPSAQTDALKINYAVGSSTATDAKNYIPVYDASATPALSYHYYAAYADVTQTWPSWDTLLAGKTSLTALNGSVALTSPNSWYPVTERYAVEHSKVTGVLAAMVSAGSWSTGYGPMMGLRAEANGAWYWPAKDGFSTTQTLGTTYWLAGNPSVPATSTRYVRYDNVSGWGWVDATISYTAASAIAETYSPTPLSATTATQTYRSIVAPGAPATLTATPNSKTSVTLSWTAPVSTGTDALTDYKIQYSTDQSTWTTFSHTASTSTSATITGLTAGSNYWFRVAAFTSIVGAYVGPISNIQSDTGTITTLTGYSVPSTATGTIRVLLWSSNAAGKLWFGSTTNIDGGIRNTANYPDSTQYNPTTGWNPATINSAGRMVGLVDTSVTDLNNALASLQYSSPTASTDTIKMWVSNGTEYIPIVNSSNVEFHYYGYSSTAANWTTSYQTNAVASRVIDGVTVSPYLATTRYRAETVYALSLTGTNNAWLAASDSSSAPVNGSEGVWKWLGPDASGVQFSSGSNAVNGEFTYWGSGNATEPNGGTGSNCMYNYNGGYTGNTIPTSGVAWNDTDCTSSKGFVWEAYNTNAPVGSNSTIPGSANYASTPTSQTISVLAPAAAPTNLSASSVTAGQVDLSWTASAAIGVTSYSVQYSSDGSTWTETRGSASTAVTQSITGLNSGTYYQFRVAAIVPTGTGYYITTYFTPNGASRVSATVSTAKTITSMAVDSSLASRYVRVLLRTANSSATLGVASPGTTGGVRGTANFTSTTATSTTAGRMIGLTGLGSVVNTALQTLQYTGPSTNGTDSIQMWVSAGTTSALPQEFVPVVNSLGQVDFHYYGYVGSSLTWQQAVNAAASISTQVNGQSASAKFLATADTVDQNALISSTGGSNTIWLNAGDYTTVNSGNSDGAWYWLGADTGATQFYNGSYTSGSGGIVGGSFIAWAASSSTQAEPNGTNTENCMSSSGNTYAQTSSVVKATSDALVGGMSWNDLSCTSTTTGYVWEYVANEPVGSGTLGDYYVGESAQAVLVNPNADAPTALTATASGTTSVALSWEAPTVYASTGITDYWVEQSANGGSTWTTVTRTASTNPVQLVTGLAANTAYQYRVRAIRDSTPGTRVWTGLTSTVANVTTRASASTITVVASGGGTVGTDFTTVGGLIAPVSGLSVSVNAADLQTVLGTTSAVIAADNVIISSAVSWSANTSLTLGVNTTSREQINADLTASGNTAGLVIASAACAYSAAGTYTGCYSIDVKSGANITLSGTTPTLLIGGTSYTVVNTVAGLNSFAATPANFSKTWALTASLDLASNPYTNPIFSGTYFTGTFDGLGNTLSNYTLTLGGSSAWELGVFYVMSNSVVRNFGVTNAKFTLNNYTASTPNYQVAGVIGGYITGTNTVDQVWSTGSIATPVTSVSTPRAIGGLLGWVLSGSTTLTRSWSGVNIDASGLSAVSQQMLGGLVAGTTDTFSGSGSSGTVGAQLTVSEAYSTGSIKHTVTGWRGIGGIVGIHYNSAALTLNDVFSWGSIATDSNAAGIVGVNNPSGLTINRGYTSNANCVRDTAATAGSTCTTGIKPGATLSGTTAAAWGSTTGTALTNLAAAVLPLYVTPNLQTGNTNWTDGSYAAVGYKVYDANGNDYTSTLGATGYPSVTGSVAWDTISASTAAGTYSVKYATGLSLTGTAASSYSLNASATAKPITLSYSSVASPPTSLTVTGTGTTTGVLGWAAPATLGTGGVTNYRIWFSTNAAMTGASTYLTGKSQTWEQLSGLAAGTTYYFKVQAIGAAWVSDVSAIASGTVKAAATALTVTNSASSNIVTTGGAVAVSGSNTTGNISVTDLQTLLAAGNSYVAADTVTVSNAVTWSSNSKLQLGNGYLNSTPAWVSTATVAINADLTATGTSAGLVISPDACVVNTSTGATASTGCYSIDTKNGANVTLSGSASTMSVANNAYTVLRTEADIAAITTNARAGWYFALGNPITLSTSYTASPVNLTYTGKFDGLGNTVNNMTIVNSTNQSGTTYGVGFFRDLGGATVRNVGFTNVNISSSVASISQRLGAVAGNGSSAGTNIISQVWATGFINQTAASGAVEAGGLFGGATGGTLTISRSWSAVAVSTQAPTVGAGGIIGSNSGSFGQANGGTGGTLYVDEVYSTGNVRRDMATKSWYGTGGIIGVQWGVSATLRNVFNWGNINSYYNGVADSTSNAGIVGVGGATITNAYTTYSSTGGTCSGTCGTSVVPGATVSGLTTGVWSSTNGASLANLPAPAKSLYVQVVAPTDGSYSSMGYRIVDSTGAVQSTDMLTAIALSVTGTPTYTIDSLAAKATYNVNYVTGLTLSGTSSGVYSLSAWINTTSVTISRDVTTLSWSPTTTFIRTDTGVTLGAPTTNTNATPSYSVSSTGNTANCSLPNSASRVLSFTATGSCTVTVSYLEATAYTAATTSITVTVTDAPPAAPTGLTVTAGGATGQLAVSWTAPSVGATGGTIATYDLDTSPDGTTWTNVATGLSVTSKTLTGLTNGTGVWVRVRAVNTAAVTGPYVTSGSATQPYWKPTNSVAPSVSGSAVGGLTLTAADGTWGTNGNTISSTTYQWQISNDGLTGWADIAAANASTYVPLATQAGKYLAVKVTKTNSAGSTSVLSAATSAVESGLAAAATLGAVARGNGQIAVSWAAPTTLNGGTISAYKVNYSTSGSTWTTFSSSVLASATSATITGLTNGTAYYVQVVPITAAGDGAAVATTSTTTPATVPSNTGVPTIAGTVAVGVALSASTGTWVTGGDAVTYSYQWQSAATANGSYTAISGATSSTYTPVTADAGLYIEVVVTATNAVGAASATSAATTVVQTGLTAAPTGLTATASNGQLVLSWTAPTTLNGGTVSDYSVSYKKSTDSTYTTVTVGSTTASKTITGLTNATGYDWSVAAVTAAGIGAVASYTSALASTPFTTPSNSAVATIANPAVAVANTATAGTWADNGRTSTLAYQWEISADNSNWSNISGATSSSYTAVTADAGKYLRVKETATNLAGSASAWSTSSVIRTGLASAPQSLAATRADSSLAVTWTAPAAVNGGTVSAYKIQTSTDGSTWTTFSSSVAAGATSATITGLTNGTAYYVRAIAITAAGDGATATTGSTTTPSTTASNTAVPAISGTTAVARQLTASTGTWSDGGAAISGYSYQWQTATSAAGTYADISGATSSTYTVASGDFGNYFKVVVTATNAAGAVSATSDASTVVISGLAAAPTFTTLTAANGQVTVNWTAPSLLNGGIISDYNVYYQASGGSTWTQVARTVSTTTSQVVTGLTNGTAYDLKVEAITGAGAGAAATYTATLSSTPYTNPVNTAAPTISGTGAVGTTLTLSNGTWTTFGRTASYTYNWRYYNLATSTWTTIAGATSSSLVIPVAYLGTTVRGQVTATIGGLSAAAYVVSSTITSGLASAPQSVTAARADQALDIAWTAPAATNGGVISSYTVQYSTDGSAWTTASSAVSASATSFTISSLTNGTPYYVQVLANTAAGASPAGAITGTATPSTTASNTVIPVINGTAAVARTLTASTGTWSDGGAAITYSYQWQAASTAAGSYSDISGATSSTYTPVTADAGTYVRVIVTATNLVGAVSATSSATSIVTTGIADAPSSVTSTFVATPTMQVTVDWAAPTGLNGAASITGYELSVSTSANGTFTTVTSAINASATSHVVTGLTSGTTYYFKVAALTAAGTGAYSTTTSGVLYGGVPSNTVAPVLSGSLGEGETLSVTDGTWIDNGVAIAGMSYQWQVSADGSTSWTDIAGATYSNYTLTHAEVSKYVRVIVEATNAIGSTDVAVSAGQIGSAIPSAPRSLNATPSNGQIALTWQAPSTANGGQIRGYTVELNDGSGWTTVASALAPSATSYTATGLTNATSYQVRVAAFTTLAGTATTLSSVIPFTVPSNTVLPGMTGSIAVAETVNALDGTWNANGRAITSTTYQWQSSSDGTNWADISGETASSYVVDGSLQDQHIRVAVTRGNAAGSVTAISPGSTVLAGVPTVDTAASISGTATVGYGFTATAATFTANDSAGISVTHRWEISADGATGWATISGATSTAYVPTSADAGAFVRYVTSASNSLNTTESVTSASAQIATGIPAAPATLTVTPGDTTLSVSWSAVTGADLNGATRASYRLEWSTDNQNWAGTNVSGTSASIASLTNGTPYFVRVAAVTTVSVTGVAKGASSTTVPYGTPINTAVPGVTGAAARGYVLSTGDGTWNANGRTITTKTYQWQRSTDSGANWTDISGATASSYTLVAADVDAFVRSAVTATNAGGSVQAFSVPTATIESAAAAAPTNLSVTPGDQQLAVTWTAPTQLAGGTIVDYEVKVSSDNITFSTVSRVASTTSNQTITGLTNGTTYWVSVAAVTTVTGAPVVSSTSTVPYGLPINQALPSVGGSLRIGDTATAAPGTWSGNGRTISAVSYQWQTSTDGGSSWANIAGQTSANYVPTGVLGQPLRVIVTESNLAGTTTAISAASANVGYGTPGAPTGITFTPGDLAVTANWTAPTWLADGVISDYTIELSNDGNTWTPVTRSASAATNQTITGLTLGATYQVRVRTETGLSSAWATSSNYVAIAKPSNSTAPAVSGTPLAGQQLSVSNGLWLPNGSPVTGYGYQWQASTDGSSWSDVAGATNSTVTAAAGHFYRSLVTATNAGGSTQATSSQTLWVVSVAPSAPTPITVTPGDQQLTVNWTTPGTLGGGTVSDYVVEYSTDGSAWTTVTRAASASTTQLITGLTNGTDYYVRVRAITSVASNYGFASTSTHPFGPPISTGSLALISGDTRYGKTLSASAGAWSWNGSASAGVSYQWQVSADSGANWSDITSATASTYVVGPYVGDLIRVRVTAMNAAGQSTAVYSTVTPSISAANPDAPNALTVSPGDQQLTLNWSAPSSLGGTALVGYTVQYSTDELTWYTAPRGSALALTETITGLVNGVDYSVRVRAMTAAIGGWSTAAAVTPFGLPQNTGAPAVSGTARYDAALSVTDGTWNDNGAASALSYQWQSNDGTGWTNIAGATGSHYTVGLVVGRTVRAVVTATNAAGATSSSSVATATIVAAQAEAVTGLTVLPADQSLSVSWTAPTYIGGSTITDYAVDISTDGSNWTSVTRSPSPTPNQTITGLTNGTPYQVRVRALNGVTGAPAIDATGVIPRGVPIASSTPVVTMHPNSPNVPQVGRAISSNAGVWNENGSSITSTSYQWQLGTGSSWTNISGATASTFTPTGNVGSQLRVVVTTANAAGSTSSTSAATGAINPAAASAPLSLSVVEQDQALAVSWQLPASTGGAAVTDYEVQTSADGTNWNAVTRAASTSTTQAITGLVNGDDIYVRVRALNGVNGAWAFASQPAVPRGLPVNTGVPAIIGTERFGAVLSANNGTWSGNGDDVESLSYQWQSSTDGSTWSNIPSATQANYTVGLYVGSTIRVRVTATNEAGSTTESSTATAVITAIPAATPVLTSQSIGNGQIALGWTPPAHTGGVDMVSYSLQYSTDQSTWTTLTFSPSTTNATISGLTNGANYFARVRAETDRAGDWSPIAGPFSPVAPPAPVVTVSRVAAPPQTVDTTSLLGRVMPVLNTSATITSLTGEPNVTVTSDGRIELQPTQSVALINGQPVQAAVTVSNTGVTVQTDTVSLSMQFNASTTSSGESEVLAGSNTSVSGGGFGVSTPVVTWIQSTPKQLSSSQADSNGVLVDSFVIPSTIEAGAHTIQVNGVDSQGQIVSIIYGVKVLPASQSMTAVGGHFGDPSALSSAFIALWMFGMALLLLLAAVWLVRRFTRR